MLRFNNRSHHLVHTLIPKHDFFHHNLLSVQDIISTFET